jgi:hypothetical protein
VQQALSAREVAQVTDLLVDACPFAPAPGQGVCADCFIYELNVNMDGQDYTVEATDMTLTDDLRALIEPLSEHLQEAMR